MRTLLNIPIPQHIFLLVLVFLLRIPSFHGAFFGEEESLYLLCAERIAAGGNMYADAWFAGPPLIIWFYTFFVWLFGDNALTLIRVFTCFYIYLTAAYFNGMIISYKPIKRFPSLPAVLVIVLTAVPWYAQELNDSLFVMFPIVLAFHTIIRVREERSRNSSRMFLVGILLMICILTTYKMVFLLLGLSISYLVLAQPKFEEFLALIGGLVVSLGVFSLLLFLNGTFGNYLDVGLLYYMDRLELAHSPLYSYDIAYQIKSLSLAWGGILVLSISGFLHFRLRFYSYVVKVRSLETVMAAWLFSILLVLAFKYQRLEMKDFVLIVPPLAFYASKMFDLQLPRLFRWIPYTLMLALPLYLHLGFLGISAFGTGNFLHPKVSQKWRHGGMYKAFTQNHEIDKQNRTKAWVMDHQPGIYHRMNWQCANKYTDFRMAYYKIAAFPKETGIDLISDNEEEREVFSQNMQSPPELILDVHDFFPYLQARFPSIFGAYLPKEYEDYTIYSIREIDEEELLDIEEVFKKKEVNP